MSPGYCSENSFLINHSAGYSKAIEVQQKTINWMLANVPDSAAIHTSYLMRYYLENQAAGYVPEGKGFRSVSTVTPAAPGYVVSCSNEPVDVPEELSLQAVEIFKADNHIQACSVYLVRP